MSTNKSNVLAYLKHTPGLEKRVRSFAALTASQILAFFQRAGPGGLLTCISRFQLKGVDLEAAL